MFKCPYCETTRLANQKPFTTWTSVRSHTSVCELRTGEWYIDSNLGPIHYTSFQKIDREQALTRFPGLSSNLAGIRKSFANRGYKIDCYPRKKTDEEYLAPILRFYLDHGRIPKRREIPEGMAIHKKYGWNNAVRLASYEATENRNGGIGSKNTYTDEYLLNQLVEFHKTHGRPPKQKDLNISVGYPCAMTYHKRFGSLTQALALVGLEPEKRGYTKDELIAIGFMWVEKNGCYPISKDFNGDLPSVKTIQNHFGNWNAYIESLGGTPKEAGVYGIPTQGLDGKVYRSRLEARFADRLFGSVNYEYETPYPSPYHRYYDFYLPDYDVYIEIDGMGSSRDRDSIAEKREINQKLGRKLIVLYPPDIDTFKPPFKCQY